MCTKDYSSSNEAANKGNPSLQGGGDESGYVTAPAFDGNPATPAITDRSANFGATKAFRNGGSHSRGPQG